MFVTNVNEYSLWMQCLVSCLILLYGSFCQKWGERKLITSMMKNMTDEELNNWLKSAKQVMMKRKTH